MKRALSGAIRIASIIFVVCAFLFTAYRPTEAGVSAEKGYYTEFDGIAVHYLDEGMKDAPALVFVHGWACDVSFWRFQFDGLRDKYRVIAVDLPGFGQSGKPACRTYTLDLFAGAVHAAIEAAGAGNPVLIGHSMGYPVTTRFLERYPGAARAIVNVDGAYFRPPSDPRTAAELKEMADFLEGLFGPERPQFVRFFIESTFYGRTPEVLRTEIMEKMSSADEYAANSSMKEFIKPGNWTERSYGVPALAIYSEHEYIPPDHEAYLRTVFPELTYEEWAETGHFLMMEAPERFNAALEKFLEGLPKEKRGRVEL